MATEPDADVTEEELNLPPEPEPYRLEVYTADSLAAIRFDLRTIADFVDQLKFILELVLYALAGAVIGWCIGTLLL